MTITELERSIIIAAAVASIVSAILTCQQLIMSASAIPPSDEQCLD